MHVRRQVALNIVP